MATIIRSHLPDGTKIQIEEENGEIHCSFDDRLWTFPKDTNPEYVLAIIHIAHNLGVEYSKKEVRDNLRSILGIE